MQKLYSLLGALFFSVLVLSSAKTHAQNVQLQSASFPSLPATSCTSTSIDVSVLLLCINATHNGNSFSISGNTITVSLDYSLGPICLGALSMQNYSINMGMIPAGSYNVVVNGVLNSAVVSTINTTLTVNSCCSAVPAFTPSSSTICVGDSIYYDNTSIGATSQQWYENGVAVGTSTHYGKQYNAIGTYSIKLVVSTTGCSDSITKVVNVTAPPTVNLGQDPTICPGGQVVLDAGSGRDSILWSDQSTLRSLVVTSPGTYYVEVFKNGCSDIDTVVVDFYNVVDVDFGNDTTICAGDTLVLDATMIGATYKWQNNSTKSTFRVYGVGTYYVERTDTNGCKARDTINVSVDANCNTSSLLESGVSSKLRVFPNPVKDKLFFDFPDANANVYAVEIIDVRGEILETIKVEANASETIILDVSKYKKGGYIVRLQSGDKTYTARWLKE